MSEGLQCLGARLGTLLVQLSPQFGCDSARLAYFLEQMPLWIKVAVEFRHPSWHTEEVFSLLEREGVAYCAPSRGRTLVAIKSSLIPAVKPDLFVAARLPILIEANVVISPNTVP